MLSDLFYYLGDFLNYVNNYVQFVLIVATLLVTLFFFMLPYIRPLKSLLKPIGLTSGEIFKILFICRRKPRKLIRIYIELAIIKTKGIYRDGSWWRSFRQVFKKFLDDNDSLHVYNVQVETPFDLANSEFTNLVNQYFKYFKQYKTAGKFAIPADQPVSFITNVTINEGYIVPITFIMGLNDRYDEDWVKILGNYFTAFQDELPVQSKILPQELYFTYNWLMWGPSYQLKYGSDTSKLIQYGFGDESNSLNVIIKNKGKGREIWDLFCHEGKMINEKKFGYNSCLTGKLFDTSDYYIHNHELVDIKAIPFLKRLSEEKLGVPYLVELIDFEIKTNQKAENYFFSAYLWIMFGLNDPLSPYFTPRKSITFFEHANLADEHNYNFLANTLVDKCFKYFDSIAEHPHYKHRVYDYCLSMNLFVEKLFLKKLDEMYQSKHGAWYRNNLLISTPYTISEILDTFDNYFVNHDKAYQYVEVNPEDKKMVKHLCNYYAEIYLDFVGARENRLSLDQMLLLLKRNDKCFDFNICLAIDENNQAVGGMIIFFFPELKIGVIECVAVQTNHRNQGVGTSLLINSKKLIEKKLI